MVASNDSPRQIGAGAALGVFIAFTPTMGIQTVLAILLATLFRVSRIPAIVTVYITNVFTAIPIYGACYWVGAQASRFLGMPVASHEAFEQFKAAILVGSDLGWLAHIWHVCETFGRFGFTIAVPLWVGGILVGLAGGAVCYPVVVRLVEGHRVLHAQRLARKLQKKVREEEAADEPATPSPDADTDVQEREIQKEAAHESELSPPGRTGAHRVDPPPEDDAAGGHRRSG